MASELEVREREVVGGASGQVSLLVAGAKKRRPVQHSPGTCSHGQSWEREDGPSGLLHVLSHAGCRWSNRQRHSRLAVQLRRR